MIDLTEDAQTRVGVLSGGQRRRVDVAIAIIGRPEVLFLDEPTTGLDPEARRHMWAAVKRLTQAGTTVLLTTHYIDEADHLADRVIVLAGGRVVTDTTPEAMRAQGGPSTIRCPMPAGTTAADLPDTLARHLTPEGAALQISSDDLTGSLRELLAWADQHHHQLTGLQVGPPSLEDAYLTAIGGLATEGTLP